VRDDGGHVGGGPRRVFGDGSRPHPEGRRPHARPADAVDQTRDDRLRAGLIQQIRREQGEHNRVVYIWQDNVVV
jgi:hypothetical protein